MRAGMCSSSTTATMRSTATLPADVHDLVSGSKVMARPLAGVCVQPHQSHRKLPAGVRGITFSSGGECLLSAVQDGLRVWGWEPVRQHDTVEVPWAKVRPRHKPVCTAGAVEPYLGGQLAHVSPL